MLLYRSAVACSSQLLPGLSFGQGGVLTSAQEAALFTCCRDSLPQLLLTVTVRSPSKAAENNLQGLQQKGWRTSFV